MLGTVCLLLLEVKLIQACDNKPRAFFEVISNPSLLRPHKESGLRIVEPKIGPGLDPPLASTTYNRVQSLPFESHYQDMP